MGKNLVNAPESKQMQNYPFGKNNPKIDYTMESFENGDQKLIEKSESERDLVVQVTSNLKYNE